MQSHDLPPSELRHGREERSKQPTNVHSEQGGKVVQDEFRGVRGSTSVSSDLLSEDDAGEFKVGSRSSREVDHGDGVWRLVILVDNDHGLELSLGSPTCDPTDLETSPLESLVDFPTGQDGS